MCVLSAGVLVFLVQLALSQAQIIPCNSTDIKCLSKSTENFLETYSAGDPKLDFLAIDPWTKPSLEVDTVPDQKIALKNVVVTGLKKLKIKDFKMDLKKKTVLLAMAASPKIEADITVVNGDTSNGKMSSQPTLLPIATYTYDLIKNDKGVTYFTVGKETLTCELGSDRTVATDEDVQKVLFKDSSRSEEVTKAILCKVTMAAFEDIIHNLRTSAKYFPATSYFEDILSS